MKRVVYFVGDNVFGKLTFNEFDVYIYNLHIGDNIYKLIIESVEDIDL